MDTQLEAVNRDIEAEKVRHKQNLDNENNLHQQRMRMLNNRKEQIKQSIQNTKNENCNFRALNKILKNYIDK